MHSAPPVIVIDLQIRPKTQVAINKNNHSKWGVVVKSIESTLYNFYLYNSRIVFIFVKKIGDMIFEDVLGSGRLWAVIYEGDAENVLTKTFSNWFDPDFLHQFFKENSADLTKYFRITNLEQAVFDSMEDAAQLACVIFDLEPDANLDAVFRPLENYRMSEMLLSKEKAKGQVTNNHPSWLRIYAIKVEAGVYLVTGGAIKLTWTMAERDHTLRELEKMERVRNYLLSNGVIDLDSLKDYTNNESN